MRNFLHYLISILLWILFGYYWYVVVQRQIGRDSVQPLGILFAITVLGLAVTLWWIAHNKRIASKGRRTETLPQPPEPFDQDYLGRPLVGSTVEDLKKARIIDIDLDDGGHKVYTTVEGDA